MKGGDNSCCYEVLRIPTKFDGQEKKKSWQFGENVPLQ
jgi:hypothetical protein